MPLIQRSRIPEPPPARPAIGAQNKRVRLKSGDAQGLVFVVDDDDLFRKSAENLFRSAGIKVKAFASAEEFLRSKRPDLPACVVLDIRLPGMSGLDLQRRMAESRIEIPIIFMTGHADIPTSVYAMKAGAVEFLTKPFSDQELIESVQKGIEQSRAARQLPICMKFDSPCRAKAQDELNRLAGEIHDGIAQYLSGIFLQLAAAKALSSSVDGDWDPHLDRAIEMAQRGLVEARRCAHGLRARVVQEPSMIVELQQLAEYWQADGKWRCQFQCDSIPENKIPGRTKHELLRIAQEAVHNAARHADPTLILLSLCWRPPNLVLEIKDNGKGISADRLPNRAGFGLGNMRKRAASINAGFELRTAPSRGTSITVAVPIR